MSIITIHKVEKVRLAELPRRITPESDTHPLFVRSLTVTSDRGDLEIELFSDDFGKLQIEDAESEAS